jgi:hypothetical protein
MLSNAGEPQDYRQEDCPQCDGRGYQEAEMHGLPDYGMTTRATLAEYYDAWDDSPDERPLHQVTLTVTFEGRAGYDEVSDLASDLAFELEHLLLRRGGLQSGTFIRAAVADVMETQEP